MPRTSRSEPSPTQPPVSPGAAQPGVAAPGVAAPGVAAELQSAAVFDIDGVLADVRHRLHHVEARPKDWEAFFGAAPADPVLPQGQSAVAAAMAAGHAVVYLTGRPERCRIATVDWLARHGLPNGPVHMRADTDRRPARVTKVAALRRLARGVRIVAFIDDDPAVVEAVRSAGFPAVQATWLEQGTTSSQALRAVLCEIQEVEGRT